MSNLGLIGKKIGMTRIYSPEGKSIPVTIIDVSNNISLQEKTLKTDGYHAIQVAYDDQKDFRLNKPQTGHYKKHSAKAKKIVREFRLENEEELPEIKNGEIDINIFKEGQFVDIIGTTKGKGFQGVYKRYNFGGSPKSHGSMMHRRTGAVGAGSTPGRIWKNTKMPGQHGNYKRTIHNLKIIQLREEDNCLAISGSIPGSKGSYVMIKPALRKKEFNSKLINNEK